MSKFVITVFILSFLASYVFSDDQIPLPVKTTNDTQDDTTDSDKKLEFDLYSQIASSTAKEEEKNAIIVQPAPKNNVKVDVNKLPLLSNFIYCSKLDAISKKDWYIEPSHYLNSLFATKEEKDYLKDSIESKKLKADSLAKINKLIRNNYKTEKPVAEFYLPQYREFNQHLDQPLYKTDYEKITFSVVGEGDLNGVRVMIDNGIDVNLRDDKNNSLLIHATINNQIDIVKYLLIKGANVNLQNLQKMTALQIAVINHNIKIAKKLLENGADPSIKDADGYNSYDYAKLRNYNDLISILEQKH